MEVLLLGSGRTKAVRRPTEGVDYSKAVTLDIDPDVNPEVNWDLNVLPYPFRDGDTFDEIHAYEVLEHCGTQGDWKFFFGQFTELWRMLKPGGKLVFSVPAPDSIWVWGDPGHSRHIHPAQVTYLSQKQYELQVGKTAMTDYRHVWKGDFEVLDIVLEGDSIVCVLEARK